MNNKAQYRLFCQQHPELPLFFQDWWLDAVCGEQWDVCIARSKGGPIMAVLPYAINRKWGLQHSRQPLLTPYLGIWFNYPADLKQRIAFENKYTYALLKQLPTFWYYRQNFHPRYHNWLVFRWRKFHQTTQYTYLLKNIRHFEAIEKGIRPITRRKIKKARQIVQIESNEDAAAFYQINQQTFARKGLHLRYTKAQFLQIDQLLKQRNCRKIIWAKDKDHQIHAAAYLVWDQQTAYYLAGGFNPQFKDSNALFLVLFEAIRSMSTQVDHFDFEGSVVRSIERVFRSFGAQQTPFFTLTKSRHWWVDLAFLLLKKRSLG
ncbi:MAG: GNAT family N-acetyltransferase [Bacteroidota bacterium]